MNKKLNNLLIVIAIIGGIICGISRMIDQNIYGALICFAIIPVMLAPSLLKQLFHIEVTMQMATIYLIFVFFAHFLGSILDLYHMVPGYDKIMHFLSGMLSAFVGFIILVKMKQYKKSSLWYHIIFIIAITLSIASLWEFYEFICDHLFGKDAQNVLTTGVDDTMLDMIMAFLASIIVSIGYYIEVAKHKGTIITGFIKEVGEEHANRRRIKWK